MATIQKLKPCPSWGSSGERLSIYTYENGGSHVVCGECFYIGPYAFSQVWAARLHNQDHERASAAYSHEGTQS